jgi:C-terminal processing protease CtpA/Prc
MDEARAVMRDMISRLKMTHFAIVPGEVYERLGHANLEGKGSAASPGFDLRLVDGYPLVMFIEKNSPAYAAGVRNGWRITKIGGYGYGRFDRAGGEGAAGHNDA